MSAFGEANIQPSSDYMGKGRFVGLCFRLSSDRLIPVYRCGGDTFIRCHGDAEEGKRHRLVLGKLEIAFFM